MSSNIHPTAVIDPTAEIAANAVIGSYCCIGPHVKIGSGTRLHSNVQIIERTELGEANEVFPNAVLGGSAQDVGHKDDPGIVRIGNRNTIREFVTINRGTSKQDLLTSIGDDNLFMAYSHVAHDCTIGNHVVLANLTQLAGHTTVHDYAITSAAVLVHQFCTIGTRCFLSPMAVIKKDCLPGVMYQGNPAMPRALNMVGLDRAGFKGEELRHIKDAYKLLMRGGSIVDGLHELSEMPWAGEAFIQTMINAANAMIRSETSRGNQ